jgi:hypothetical protein
MAKKNSTVMDVSNIEILHAFELGGQRNESKTREAHTDSTLRSLRSYNHRCRPMGGLVPQMSSGSQTKVVLVADVLS